MALSYTNPVDAAFAYSLFFGTLLPVALIISIIRLDHDIQSFRTGRILTRAGFMGNGSPDRGMVFTPKKKPSVPTAGYQHYLLSKKQSHNNQDSLWIFLLDSSLTRWVWVTGCGVITFRGGKRFFYPPFFFTQAHLLHP